MDERDETVGKRIRDAEVEKIPFVIVFGDKESEESLAVREHGGEQSTKSLDEFRVAPCYAVILASRVSPHLPSRALLRRFNRVGRRGILGRCLQRLLSFEKEELRTW